MTDLHSTYRRPRNHARLCLAAFAVLAVIVCVGLVIQHVLTAKYGGGS
jgi:hypothetical protein